MAKEITLDNLDEVIQGLAKLEKAAEMDVIRDARKRMRATIRKYIPVNKKVIKENTTKRSGQLVKSVKVQSRSRRGVSNVKLVFTVPYAGYLNFTQNYKTEGMVTDQYKKDREALDAQGLDDVRKAFETTFDKYGVKYK